MQKYQDVVLKPDGSVIQGASVLVQSYPGAVTSTIYSDDGVTTQANPMTTDSLGGFAFYAELGRYQLVISGNNIATKTITDIQIGDERSGTWTPAVTSATGTLGTVLYSQGTYLKVESLVRCTFAVSILFNGTGGGAINLSNFPFPASSANIYGLGQGFGGTLLFVSGANETFVSIQTFARTYPGGDGVVLEGYFEYVAA